MNPGREGQTGRVAAVCVSDRVGEKKRPVDAVEVRAGHGIVGDAHAGTKRPLSLLASEEIDAFRAAHPGLELGPGAFAENFTIAGIDWSGAAVGESLTIGAVRGEITQIGKSCHQGCAIRTQTGACIMPKRGLFLAALTGGTVRPGDPVHYPAPDFPVAVLTVSDRGSRGESADESGDWLAVALLVLGPLAARNLVPDEPERIAAALKAWCDGPRPPALIVTTGGTGLSPRDLTPEATRAVLEREAPGLMELARSATGRDTPRAYLSRGLAGTRGTTLIVNLPGSARAVREMLAVLLPLLPHALATVRGRVGDCGRPGEPRR